MKKIVTIILTLWSLELFAQNPTKIGATSPNLVFEQIINFNQGSATLADFKGKVIILDFWATWCAPCIKSLPELEALQTKYKSDLQVITITSDDPAERIENFLSKKKLNLPVVIDEKRKLAEIFPHRTIPHTIVIDKLGIVRAITSSEQITDEVIGKVINGQEINITEKKEVMDFDPTKPLSGNDNFTYQITITPFQEGFPSFSNIRGEGIYKNRRIYATNITAKVLFEIAYSFPASTKTIIEVKDVSKMEWNKNNTICFDLIVPEKLSEQRFEIMKQQLELYFDYKAVTEERLKKVKVLRQVKNSPKNLLTKNSDNTEASFSYGGKGLSMKNSPVSTLAKFLEDQLSIPVIDETNLIEKYDLKIAWYHENPQQIHQELKKIGLELVSEERKIKILVIKDK